MVEVYAIKIDEYIEDEMYNRLLSCVSEKKRKKIKKFRFIEDAKRTLYGDLMVRSSACDKLKVHNDKLTFCCNEFGKPFLEGYPYFHYNISHSGDWVVCAIGEREVGIDVEQIKPDDFSIAKSRFTNEEYQSLIKQPKELQLEYFYNLWTLKESYIKCIGKGLSVPLNSFSVCINKKDANILPKCFPDMYLYLLSLDSKHKLSVCSEDECQSLAIKIKNISNIKEELLYGNQRKNY